MHLLIPILCIGGAFATYDIILRDEAGEMQKWKVKKQASDAFKVTPPFYAIAENNGKWYKTTPEESGVKTTVTLNIFPEEQRIKVFDELMSKGEEGFDLDKLDQQIIHEKPRSLICRATHWSEGKQFSFTSTTDLQADTLRLISKKIPEEYLAKYRLCSPQSKVFSNSALRSPGDYIYCIEEFRSMRRYHVFEFCDNVGTTIEPLVQ